MHVAPLEDLYFQTAVRLSADLSVDPQHDRACNFVKRISF